MRILVCGGRDFEDGKAVNRTLSAIHAKTPITLVISGGARGADRLAEKWADRMHIPLMVFPAHWSMGKRAGPTRNSWMLEFGLPTLVVAFPTPGAENRGTNNMIHQAMAKGVTVAH